MNRVSVKNLFNLFLVSACFWRQQPMTERIPIKNYDDPSLDIGAFSITGHNHGEGSLSRYEHYTRDKRAGRRIFGLYAEQVESVDVNRGYRVKKHLVRKANPVHSILLVPELHKRRSERDPELLRKQQMAYRPC